MRQACFDYLSLGGVYSAGPISLLSGLNPKPSVLVMHFFMVPTLARAVGGGDGGLLSLMSGVRPRPLLLVTHFFGARCTQPKQSGQFFGAESLSGARLSGLRAAELGP